MQDFITSYAKSDQTEVSSAQNALRRARLKIATCVCKALKHGSEVYVRQFYVASFDMLIAGISDSSDWYQLCQLQQRDERLFPSRPHLPLSSPLTFTYYSALRTTCILQHHFYLASEPSLSLSSFALAYASFSHRCMSFKHWPGYFSVEAALSYLPSSRLPLHSASLITACIPRRRLYRTVEPPLIVLPGAQQSRSRHADGHHA